MSCKVDVSNAGTSERTWNWAQRTRKRGKIGYKSYASQVGVTSESRKSECLSNNDGNSIKWAFPSSVAAPPIAQIFNLASKSLTGSGSRAPEAADARGPRSFSGEGTADSEQATKRPSIFDISTLWSGARARMQARTHARTHAPEPCPCAAAPSLLRSVPSPQG